MGGKATFKRPPIGVDSKKSKIKKTGLGALSFLDYFSLRTIKYTIVLSLSAVALIWAFNHLSVLLEIQRQTENQLNNHEVADLLMTASQQWLEERGRAVMALTAPESAMTATITAMTDRQMAADKAYQIALSKLRRLPLPRDVEDETQRLEAEYDALNDSRAEVGREVTLSRSERGAALLGRTESSFARIIERAQALRQTVDDLLEQEEVLVSRLDLLTSLTWLISDHLSRERDELAEVINQGVPIPPGINVVITGNRARVDQAWDNLRAMVGRDSRLSLSVNELRAALVGRYQKLRFDVIQAGVKGRPYEISGWDLGQSSDGAIPITADEFWEQATSVVGKAIEVQTAISQYRNTYLSDLYNSTSMSVFIDVIAIALTSIISLLFIIIAHYRLISPLSIMASSMKTLSGGDLSIEVIGMGRRDEIGAMANALQVFKEGLIQVTQMTDRQRHEQETKDARSARLAAMIDEFDQRTAGILGTVAQAADDLDATARGMAEVAQRSNHQAKKAINAATQTHMNIEVAADAVGEMIASIKEITEKASRSRVISEDCVEEVQRTDLTVAGMVSAAERIGNIVELIRAIAEKTNLLALNATIEAARAGDAGKGFAVVAGEVKLLAAQTAGATGEIAEQVTAIQAVSRESVDAIRSISWTIQSMNEITMAIAAAMDQQQANTGLISVNVQKAALGSQEVSDSVTVMTKAAYQADEAAKHVVMAADDLNNQMISLSSDIKSFTSNVNSL